MHRKTAHHRPHPQPRACAPAHPRSGELAGKEEALAALQVEKEELEGKHTELRWGWLGGCCLVAGVPQQASYWSGILFVCYPS